MDTEETLLWGLHKEIFSEVNHVRKEKRKKKKTELTVTQVLILPIWVVQQFMLTALGQNNSYTQGLKGSPVFRY